MKKKTVAKLKVTRKLEDILPAFLCCFAYHGITIKRSYPHSNFFSTYPTQYQPDYINDFSNISTISTLLSAIFSLYRRFDIGYRLTDNFRQSIYALYPATTIKRSYPHSNSFSIYPTQYQPDYINDFSNISTISTLLSAIFSLYRRFDTRYRFNDNLRHSKRTTYPIPQAIYCRALRLKR